MERERPHESRRSWREDCLAKALGFERIGCCIPHNSIVSSAGSSLFTILTFPLYNPSPSTICSSSSPPSSSSLSASFPSSPTILCSTPPDCPIWSNEFCCVGLLSDQNYQSTPNPLNNFTFDNKIKNVCHYFPFFSYQKLKKGKWIIQIYVLKFVFDDKFL